MSNVENATGWIKRGYKFDGASAYILIED